MKKVKQDTIYASYYLLKQIPDGLKHQALSKNINVLDENIECF